MTIRVVPSKIALWALAAGAIGVLLGLVAGLEPQSAALFASVWAMALAATGIGDYLVTRKAWQEASPRLSRRLPDALAIGVRSDIHLCIETQGGEDWRCELFDHVDPTLLTQHLQQLRRPQIGDIQTRFYCLDPHPYQKLMTHLVKNSDIILPNWHDRGIALTGSGLRHLYSGLSQASGRR